MILQKLLSWQSTRRSVLVKWQKTLNDNKMDSRFHKDGPKKYFFGHFFVVFCAFCAFSWLINPVILSNFSQKKLDFH